MRECGNFYRYFCHYWHLDTQAIHTRQFSSQTWEKTPQT